MRASLVFLSGLSGGVFCLSHLCRGPCCSTTLPASLNTECWRGLAPERPSSPAVAVSSVRGSRCGLLGGGTTQGAKEGEGWALPVPPLPGSFQMVAAVPRHEAWLALSRRQHPGAGAGQESRVSPPASVGGRPEGAGSPSSPRPSVLPALASCCQLRHQPCISFSSSLCTMRTHLGEETLQALVRFSCICVLYFCLVPRTDLVMWLGETKTLLLTELEACGQSL